MLIFTGIFDSLMIAAGLFDYNPQTVLGIYLWRAPIEDFIYPIASVLLVGLLWVYYEDDK